MKYTLLSGLEGKDKFSSLNEVIKHLIETGISLEYILNTLEEHIHKDIHLTNGLYLEVKNETI